MMEGECQYIELTTRRAVECLIPCVYLLTWKSREHDTPSQLPWAPPINLPGVRLSDVK